MTKYMDCLVTFPSEDEARETMRCRNRTLDREVSSRLSRENDDLMTVMVEGPEDGDFSLMSLTEAIAQGFCYSWDSGR